MSKTPGPSQLAQLTILILAAFFEVGGDALVRAGLRSKGLLLIACGFLILGSYGLVINQIPIDFSRLLGAYVGIFALVSVLFGVLLFHEVMPTSTWLGLGVVLVGSAIIQFG